MGHEGWAARSKAVGMGNEALVLSAGSMELQQHQSRDWRDWNHDGVMAGVLPGALWGRSPREDFPSLSMRRQLGASSPPQPPVSLPGSGI